MRRGLEGRHRHDGRHARYRHREGRPAARRRRQGDRQVEHAGNAIDDGEAEAQAPLLARRLVFRLQPDEFVEDDRLLVGCDAGAVVLHLDAQPLAAGFAPDVPAAKEHAPRPAFGLAVAQGVRQQILKDTPQESGIGGDERPGRHHDQFDAAPGGDGGEGGGQGLEQRLQGERPLLGLEGAGIELRDIEQGVEQRFHGAQAGVDLGAEIVAGLAVDHRGGEEPRGVKRLQQVMAGGGDEARLAEIGGLGLGPARLQLGGALDHPLFEGFGRLPELAIALAQGLGGTHARRYIVAGRDEAIAGQRVETKLDSAALTGDDLMRLRRGGSVQQRHHVGGGAKLLWRGAHRDRVVVERQQGGEAIVEDLQTARAIEGGNPHADVIERVAQDFVVVADRLGRLVD